MSAWDQELLAAAYRVDGSTPEWLGTLAAHAVEPLTARDGVYAYSYRITGAAIVLGGVATWGAGAGYWAALARWGAENTASIARLYKTQVMTLGSALAQARALGLSMSDPGPRFGRHGVRDLLVVMGQAGDSGLILTAPWRAEVGISERQRQRLERLAAELCVAQRARWLRRPALGPLSAREQQVALGLQRGLGDKAIAHGLGLSGSAVAAYTARLRSKLGCSAGEELLLLHGARGDGSWQRSQLAARLTPAEHGVACSLVAGLSHLEIARERGSSSRTVASQVASVFRKAGVSGRRELTARWFGASGK